MYTLKGTYGDMYTHMYTCMHTHPHRLLALSSRAGTVTRKTPTLTPVHFSDIPHPTLSPSLGVSDCDSLHTHTHTHTLKGDEHLKLFHKSLICHNVQQSVMLPSIEMCTLVFFTGYFDTPAN